MYFRHQIVNFICCFLHAIFTYSVHFEIKSSMAFTKGLVDGEGVYQKCNVFSKALDFNLNFCPLVQHVPHYVYTGMKSF